MSDTLSAKSIITSRGAAQIPWQCSPGNQIVVFSGTQPAAGSGYVHSLTRWASSITTLGVVVLTGLDPHASLLLRTFHTHASAANNTTSTMRLWWGDEIKIPARASGDSEMEYGASYMGELALVAGATALAADSRLLEDAPDTHLSSGWVDTYTVTTDDSPPLRGFEVYSDSADGCAVLRLENPGSPFAIVSLKIGTAAGVGFIYSQGA